MSLLAIIAIAVFGLCLLLGFAGAILAGLRGVSYKDLQDERDSSHDSFRIGRP